MGSRWISALVLAASWSFASQVRAEELAVEGESVELSAILPVLAGTELGHLVVADAPLPGETRIVRASDIKALLKSHGADTRGLALPSSVKLVRHARSVNEAELVRRVREVVSVQLAPCTVDGISSLPSVNLGTGDYEVLAQASPRRDSGRVPLVITLKQGTRSQRISAQLDMTCPAPVMQPGANVRLVVRSGLVRVSAPATAHQPGRVGDQIRVTNQLTRRQMTARVLDAQTVEVVQ